MRRLVLLAFLALVPVVASLAAAGDGIEAAKAAKAAEAAKPYDDDFLAEVELLSTDAERAAYLALEKPYQRQQFERRFWEVRDPYPQTPRNELADRWHERWALARERYPHLDDDRRAVLMLAGEPARTIRIRCAQLLRVGEIWAYTRTDAIPDPFVLVFLTGGLSEAVPHHLWTARGGLHEAFAAGGGGPFGTAGGAAERIVQECPRGEDLLSLLAAASDWNELVRHYPVVPRPDPEWVHAFQSASTDLPAGAAPLPGEVEIRFSGRNQSRTVVDAAVLVAAADFAAGAGLVLDGEVLRGDELFDQFRYRFDPPSGMAPRDRVPFAARRFLRPGEYTLVLRLHDPASGRYFRAEQPLAVPPPAEAERALAESAAKTVERLAAAAPRPPAKDSSPAVEPRLRLIAPVDRLVAGRVRVEAIVEGFEPARVEFTLDGQPLLSKRSAPYSVDLDLGRVPRLRRLSAIAFDAAGAAVAEDELVLNAGPHRFAVRLVEPERAPAPGERIEARARVDLPEGEALERVEFWLDDERFATLYQPPFAVALEAPRGRRVSYLRAVAFLTTGVAAEDVRFLAGGEDSFAVEVDFVELYTTALDRRGRPVADLRQEELTVREDGVVQTIRRFEKVDTAPIHAGVMIDTSSSMLEDLEDARIGAERFFREILTKSDRAAVIPFADAPRLAVRFTNDLELLAGGLAGLEADGQTSLYDAIGFALHYFAGVRGKRAIVVLSDFADSGSRFRPDEIVEFARRTGVAIYGIGLDVPREIPEAGAMLDRLTRETGGRAFRISRVGELRSVYESIRGELRAQYLIAYQSSRDDGSQVFREVEVEVARPGVQARTVSGYYP